MAFSPPTVPDSQTANIGDARERLALLQALRRSPVFGRTSAHLFHDLLSHAHRRELERGDRLAHEEEHFFAVLSGRLHVYTTTDGGPRQLQEVLKAGDTFGEAALLRGQQCVREVLADSRATVIVIPKRALAELPGHMHRELALTSQQLEGQAHDVLLAPHEPTVIYVSAPEGLDAPSVDALCCMLARTIEAEFSEKVTVVAPTKGGWRRLMPPEPLKKGKPPKAQAGFRAAAGEQLHADYLIVSLQDERRPHALPDVQGEAWRGLHVVLTPPDTDVQCAGPDREQVLQTVLLDPSASRRTRRTTLELQGYESGRKRSCRLMLGAGAIARAVAAREPAAQQAFLEDYQDTLSRWARFVTRRSVAFALGGGGAWGYFHVALLQAVIKAGVPIDITSGTSFGALVSVYYASEGLAGLDKLVQRGRSLAFTQALSMVSTHPLELNISDDLGGVDLSRIPIAANPFTTNLTAVEGQAAYAGPVALGARASSSAPGLFGPTVLAGRGVFVDGVVAGNVPSAILISQGADMLVASNVIPRPASKPVPRWAPARWLSTVSPIDRVYEAFLATMFFLYAQGLEEPGLGCLAVQGNDVLESFPRTLTPSDFAEGAKIVEHAHRQESLQQSVEEIVREWDRRRGSRSA